METFHSAYSHIKYHLSIVLRSFHSEQSVYAHIFSFITLLFRWVSPLILLVTMAYDSFCIVIHQRAYHFSSSIQFFFWLLMVTCGAPTFASSVIMVANDDSTKHDNFKANVRILSYFFYVFIFVLNFFSESPRSYEDREVELPTAEERASPLSTLLFSWLDPLIWAGFNAPLDMEAVPKTKHQMSAAEVEKRFSRHLVAAGR